MYLAIPPQASCAQAWVAASSAIADEGEAYNVVIDVDDPVSHSEQDHKAIGLVDAFLRKHDAYAISTVANTIFPQALYVQHGAPDFYDVYLKGFDRLQRTKRWGRYFERMIRHRTANGEVTNPLAFLVEKIRKQQTAKQMYRCAYELAIYDPLFDGRTFYGGQCLSFLSFKLHPERGLTMTAMYRNHTYITRCLGNLIGLGRLQGFIAKETGFKVGPLTCISTHAELDTGEGWGINDARKLVSDAAALLKAAEPSVRPAVLAGR